MQVVFLKMD